MPFVLNVLDYLAGDESLIAIRKHRPIYKTLEKVAEKTAPYQKEADEFQQKFNSDFEKARSEAQKEFSDRIEALSKDKENKGDELFQQIALAKRDGELRLTQKIKKLEQKRDRDVEQKRRDLGKTIRSIQDQYKLQGVLLPPILPLAVAFFVYFNRRAREREGVNKTRLRS